MRYSIREEIGFIESVAEKGMSPEQFDESNLANGVVFAEAVSAVGRGVPAKFWIPLRGSECSEFDSVGHLVESQLRFETVEKGEVRLATYRAYHERQLALRGYRRPLCDVEWL